MWRTSTYSYVPAYCANHILSETIYIKSPTPFFFLSSQTLSLGPLSSGGNGDTLFPVHLKPKLLSSYHPWITQQLEPTGGAVTASLRVVSVKRGKRGLVRGGKFVH